MIVPYKPKHAFEILDRNIRDVDIQLSKVMDWEEQCREWANHPAYTLIMDGEIVGCGGILLMGYNRGEAWILFSKLLERYPVACMRASKKILIDTVREHGLNRVQALILKGHQKGQEFVKRFGFSYEGTLRKYGPNGESMHMYARIS